MRHDRLDPAGPRRVDPVEGKEDPGMEGREQATVRLGVPDGEECDRSGHEDDGGGTGASNSRCGPS